MTQRSTTFNTAFSTIFSLTFYQGGKAILLDSDVLVVLQSSIEDSLAKLLAISTLQEGSVSAQQLEFYLHKSTRRQSSNTSFYSEWNKMEYLNFDIS